MFYHQYIIIHIIILCFIIKLHRSSLSTFTSNTIEYTMKQLQLQYYNINYDE